MSADLSVAIKLDVGNDNTALTYSHSLCLQSPSFPAPHSDMCLTLEYTSMGWFSVKLVCLPVDKGAEEQVLRWSSQPLGVELNRMNLVIPGKGVEYEKCLLSFHMSSTKSGLLAAISSVNLTEGTCASAGLSLFIICYFVLVLYCYESHSPNKILIVVYGDSIV